ncbi:MAG: prepilin-type N-terminal cleavage/methylation domain-containing protein [Endomicrobium sp.]|jgi:type IV pilus assembly protein PilE|nr:prepilin-type N-terminal cleavage/methylation domain-containing protein [Endomicrobium sp.]
MKSKGFTLVELLILIVIVGVLSIIAIPIYKSYIVESRIVKNSTAVEKAVTAEKVPL